ncbi:MAG: RNA polymerase sigma factor [Bacteroidales bacterium]
MSIKTKEELFEEVYTEYRLRIYRICYGYIYEKEQVEDLFQEIMINVWNSLDKFKGDSSIGTWTYKVAVNTALLYNRNTKQYKKIRWAANEINTFAAFSNPNDKIQMESRLNHLGKSVSELEKQDRLIISLILEGQTYEQVAEIVGITTNYVGVKVTRIKKQLYELLKKYDNE